MRTTTSCGWCHALNPTTECFCKECGHEAHVSRMLCRCPRCSRRTPAGQGGRSGRPARHNDVGTGG
jgi:hypothetical protein